jgi:hypothetical protein
LTCLRRFLFYLPAVLFMERHGCDLRSEQDLCVRLWRLLRFVACCALVYPAAAALPRVHLVGITLVRGAIGFGSEFNMQWNPAQCAVVGIGLVSIQLTSEWNWMAGAPR